MADRDGEASEIELFGVGRENQANDAVGVALRGLAIDERAVELEPDFCERVQLEYGETELPCKFLAGIGADSEVALNAAIAGSICKAQTLNEGVRESNDPFAGVGDELAGSPSCKSRGQLVHLLRDASGTGVLDRSLQDLCPYTYYA